MSARATSAVAEPLSIAILGLSITSSWGNGHAVTYRGLVRALAARGHDVLFLERDVPWYRAHRDLPHPPGCTTRLYDGIDDLHDRFGAEIRRRDLVIVGSYVPDGIDVARFVAAEARGVAALYDIDTPVTVKALQEGTCSYLTAPLVGRFDLYLSFTGGPLLREIERTFGVPLARPLYCSADPAVYFPTPGPRRGDLGYMGTYSPDRQPTLDRLLVEPARRLPSGRFLVAGPSYPEGIAWPANVARVDHIAPAAHAEFYNAHRFVLNVTRADMIARGWSPSVRLFEAAACGRPVLSDAWAGLEEFFVPGEEILVARGGEDVVGALVDVRWDEAEAIGARARERFLREHTPERRVRELEAAFAAAAALAGRRVGRAAART